MYKDANKPKKKNNTNTREQKTAEIVYKYSNKGKDQVREAVDCFQQAVMLNSNYIEAHLNKGNALSKLVRYDDGLLEDNQALEIDPNYINGLINKGVALGNLGRNDEALQVYDHILDIHPNHPAALHNKKRILSEKNKILLR
jgi:tetratricopeptide (TPR) repeat protein